MTAFDVVVVLAVIATAAVLGMGLYSMLRGGTYDRQHAGQFMSARVGLQAATVVLVLAAIALA